MQKHIVFEQRPLLLSDFNHNQNMLTKFY